MVRFSPYPAWTVIPHGPLEAVDSNVWRLEGTLEGMTVRRVMTVARRSDGRVVLFSPIAVSDPVREEIEALGPVSFLVATGRYHRLDLAGYRQRYPSAKLLCPKGARDHLEKVAKVDGSNEDFPADADVDLFTFAGTNDGEGGLLVRSAGGATLCVGDVVFNMPHQTGFRGWVLRHVTQSSGGPRVSRLARSAIIGDKPAFRAELERLAATPNLVRVIVSHHEMIDRDAPNALRDVAATLT